MPLAIPSVAEVFLFDFQSQWEAILAGAGVLLGLSGLLATVYAYRKTHAEKRLCFFCATKRDIERLIDKEDKKLQVFYDGEYVDRVFTTYVWIWNQGKEPIRRYDLVPTSPITINIKTSSDEFRMLDYAVIKCTRDAIDAKVAEVYGTSISFLFEFLDSRDGFLVEIKHTGGRNIGISLAGTVLGHPRPFDSKGSRVGRSSTRVSSPQFTIRPFRTRVKHFITSIIGLSVLFGTAFALGEFFDSIDSPFFGAIRIFFVATFFAGIFAMIARLSLSRDFPFPDSLSLESDSE